MRAGCKGRAQKGSIFCYGHNPQIVRTGGPPPGNQNARIHGLYAKYLTEEERAFLEEAANDQGKKSLEEEICIARLTVKRLLAAHDDIATSKALLVVGQLKRMAHQIGGEQATGLLEGINAVLAELGLGERDN